MELWIRSQDRRDLVKVESVILCFNEDKPDNGYSLKDKSDRWYPDILGTYKTKERALEVLDEIQGKIAQNECLKQMMSKVTDIRGYEEKFGKLFKETIYEMPKE